MSQLTIAQLRQKKEREMMKRGVSPVCLAFPEHDVQHRHNIGIRKFLISLGVNSKEIQRQNYTEFVSKNLYPEHHSKISVLSVNRMIFLVQTEGTCVTHKLQAENPEFADDDIEVVPPRTIIINISGVLSGQEISASVLSHELAHAKFPRSSYHTELCISSGNLSQKISVSMNLYQLGAEENGSDGSVRKNIVINPTKILSPLVTSDGTVFLADLLDDDTTMDRVKPGEEEKKVVGSIRFEPVFNSDLQSTNMQQVD